MATAVLESRTANTPLPRWEGRDALQSPSYFPLGVARVNNPAHPNRTEDSAAAFSVANGEGFALVVADGMSSGGEASKHAADFITAELQRQFRYCTYLPSKEQVDEIIVRALYTASDKTFKQLVKPTYESLVGTLGEDLAKIEANNIGSTVCAAVRCLDENGEPAIRIAARGDSSCYAFDIASGRLELVFPNEATLDSHNDGLLDWVCNYYVGEMEVKKKGFFTYKPEGGNKILFSVTDGFYFLPDEAQQFFVQVAFREAFDVTGGFPAQTGERFMHIFTRSLMYKCTEYIAGFASAPDDEPPGDDISIAATYMPQEFKIWERPTAIYDVSLQRRYAKE